MVKSCCALLAVLATASAASLPLMRYQRELATAAPSAAPTGAPADGEPTDADYAVAAFALNLECLEAEFYSCAATGEGLSDELRGGGPPSIGCAKANLTPAAQAFAEELAKNEIAHVAFLRTVLGDMAPACPQMDIGPAFAAAANAALSPDAPLVPAFTPYFNDAWFYLGAFIFEDVGVTAYQGAIGALTAYAAPAAAIEAVEAYHAGAVRSILSKMAATVLTPYPVTVEAATTAVSDLRAAVGGGKDSAIIVDGVAVIVPADENSLAYGRTVAEVLAIVYLGAADTPGGFFPMGVNGLVMPMA